MFSMFSKKRNALNALAARRSRPVIRPQASSVARAVSHEHWIPVRELELGMYVLELNVPWEDTGFMFQGFPVDSMALLKQVINTCDEVLIRSEKVAYISRTSSHRLCGVGR